MKSFIYIGAAILTGGIACALVANKRKKKKEEIDLEIQRELDELAMSMVSSETLEEYKKELYRRYYEED